MTTLTTKSKSGVIERCGANPIITPDQVAPSHSAYRVRGAFNPGAAVVGDEVVLLLRVAEDVPTREGRVAVPIIRGDAHNSFADVLEVDIDDPAVELRDTRGVCIDGIEYLSTMSHLRLARSTDGVHFTIDEQPFLLPELESERYGVEDARITRLGDRYLVNYTAVSGDGWATGLLETFDFRHFDRLGLIFHPNNKDVSIFPERSGGLYRALHRPNNAMGKASIWYAESPDLMHWGNHHCVLRPRDTQWEEVKIGGGGPSILTDEGWLQIYHGKGRDQLYSLWAVLLDRHDPTRVLARGVEPLMVPEAPYETEGFFGNVVFTNGVVERDGELLIYYGAADEVTCLAATTTEAVLDTLR
ncbi:MAG: glycoside hydrolase family 130 protein [Actinomycetota bacterium]